MRPGCTPSLDPRHPRVDTHPTPSPPPQDAREVVQGVERLDGALKRREGPEVVSPIIQKISERLGELSVAAARLGDVS
jgi:hypothetical protein